MLQSHRPTPLLHGLPPAPYRPAFGGTATALTLPAIGADIPARFAVHSKSDTLLSSALTLADAGVLTVEHWDNNLRTSVAAAFTALGQRLMPRPAGDYTLLVAESTVEADLEYDTSHGYQRENDLPEKTKVSALILTFGNEAIVHRVIGPAIQRLEKHRAGLGQTIFYWLHSGFSESARAVDPATGYDWAQYNYWGGEADETTRLEEELDSMRHSHEHHQKDLPKAKRTPFDETAARKEIDIFTKADYDQAIPPEFGTKFRHRPQLTIGQLKRELHTNIPQHHHAIIEAALAVAALLKGRKHKATLNDIGCFERCRWDMSPYLLRRHCTADRKSQDPLAHLYDDYMNDCMQSGEDMLDVNAVFAWHDEKTFRSAVQRFEDYCRLLNAAEQLLLTIAPKDT